MKSGDQKVSQGNTYVREMKDNILYRSVTVKRKIYSYEDNFVYKKRSEELAFICES